MVNQEYLRRDMQVAKAIGANAAAETALQRLAEMKRPPLWIIQTFEAIKNRIIDLPPEVAKWRDEIDPYWETSE